MMGTEELILMYTKQYLVQIALTGGRNGFLWVRAIFAEFPELKSA